MYKCFRGRSHRKTGVFLRETRVGQFLLCFRGCMYSIAKCPPLAATLQYLAPHCPRAPCPPSCCTVRPQKVELYLASTEYLLCIYTVSTRYLQRGVVGSSVRRLAREGAAPAVLLDTGALTNNITH